MAEEAAVSTKEKADFQIFGSVDLDTKGNVKSTYPSWYFTTMLDNLREEIQFSEYQIRDNFIPASELHVTQERLRQKKDKLKELESAIPRLNGRDKDTVAKVRDELSEKIRDKMYTREQMRKGLADAHQEARHMLEPCIELKGDALAMAKRCNVQVGKGGKVSRTGAEKTWKIMSKILEESTNVESLRRD
jgi:hypothetical protein